MGAPGSAVEVRGLAGLPEALSLKGRRKSRARPHLRRKLGGQARAFSSAAAAAGAGAERLRSPRPLVLGAPAPSRSLPSRRLPRSLCPSRAPSLARSPARSLARSHFFLLPSGCRGASGRPPLGRLRSLLGSRSTPFPAASPRPDPAPWSAGTPGSAAVEAGLAAAPWLAVPGAAARPPRAWRRLRPGGRQLVPAASRTPGGSAPGSVRSVSASRPGLGSGHREKQASGRRLPTPPTPRLRAVSCGPRGTGRGTVPSGLWGAGCGGRSGALGGGFCRAPALGAARRKVGGPEPSRLEGAGPGLEGLPSGPGRALPAPRETE